MNYAAYYPPGADDDLMRRERDQEAADARLIEIEREYRDDPASLAADYPDEHHVRLGRMLKHIKDRQNCRITEAEFWTKMQTEYNAVMLVTTHWQAKQEGIL